MAIVSAAVLASINAIFRGDFQQALTDTPTEYRQIATVVPSTGPSNVYGWLGQFPMLREWVGDRVVKDMKEQGYTLQNKLYEGTVGVPRTAIEDDQAGVYRPLFQEQGRAAATHPDVLVFDLLAAGDSSPCYDGQNFFDTEHPVYPNHDGTGVAELVSNLLIPEAGAGARWYLLDTSRALKPLIYQERTKPELQSKTNVSTDEAAWSADEYQYGIRVRGNAGFGLWQLAVASEHPLDAAGYAMARQALAEMKADGGRKLGVKGTLLVVPASLEGAARALIMKDKDGGNEWFGTCEVLVSSNL